MVIVVEASGVVTVFVEITVVVVYEVIDGVVAVTVLVL